MPALGGYHQGRRRRDARGSGSASRLGRTADARPYSFLPQRPDDLELRSTRRDKRLALHPLSSHRDSAHSSRLGGSAGGMRAGWRPGFAAWAQGQNPNVIIFLADDMGIGDTQRLSRQEARRRRRAARRYREHAQRAPAGPNGHGVHRRPLALDDVLDHQVCAAHRPARVPLVPTDADDRQLGEPADDRRRTARRSAT